MNDNVMMKINAENSKRNYSYAIDRMKNKAWKISQTSKKDEREQIAIELTESLDVICEDIMNMLDDMYASMENID